MFRKIIIPILIVVLSFHLAFTLTTDPLNDTTLHYDCDYSYMARLYHDRSSAIISIKSLPNLDTAWAVNTIINAINNEISNPLPFGYPRVSFGTFSQNILRQDIFALAKLGQTAWPLILEKRKSLTGLAWDWATIVSGYQAADTVHDDIRTIFKNNEDPTLKAMAAVCMGIYKDTSDADILIPVFSRSFHNPAYINPDSSGYSLHNKINLVWIEVAGALSSLGYKVAWDSLKQEYYLEN